MKKLFIWCKDHLLFLFTLFLLAFIPLYPKLPVVDVTHVWVYVRLEDFIVAFMLLIWAVLVLLKKISLKTPLTIPILLFWLAGAIATIHGLLIIFPQLENVFANVAFLSYVRRVEYISLFFIAYAGIKDKRFFHFVVIILTATILAVILYGIGQKYMSFPAYLTMNEEFAKGTPLTLSALSRVSSTFGGHYDLAAYLVLMLPVLVSLAFGYRNKFVKAVLLGITTIGMWVLFMTVSRISFVALFVAFGLILLFQKRKLVIVLTPIIAVIVILFLTFTPSLRDRFGSTLRETDVILQASTGMPIGQVIEVPNTYFADKVVEQQFIKNIEDVNNVQSSPSGSFIIPFENLPPTVMLFTEPNAPTGENLPQGTSYVNLPLSPVLRHLGEFYFERKTRAPNGKIDVQIVSGDYLVKRAQAYDLSFTTRFQGEWPNAMEAFKRNILFGSGYGSVSLAVDNSYLRALAETGLLGFISFLAIFVGFILYLWKALPHISSRPVKSFIFGFMAGIAGLSINGIFIDVFESSKVAFTLWLMVGISIALVHQYYGELSIQVVKELRRLATSPVAIIVYLFIFTFVFYSQLTRNYFVGDDFTWFRWAASCGDHITTAARCPNIASTILGYFIHSDGFFYRPGAKLYFFIMYQLVWMNQNAYHIVSISLHFIDAVLVYLLARKLFKREFLAVLTGFFFAPLTGSTEAIFWISATGFLFTSVFALAGLLMFILWTEQRKKWYFAGSALCCILSLLFHELGIITPLLYLAYQYIFVEPMKLKNLVSNTYWRILFAPLPVYVLVRFISKSLWFNGDYSYNLVKLPLNVIGNSIGYAAMTFAGPFADSFYTHLREFLKGHVAIAMFFSVVVIALLIFVAKWLKRMLKKDEQKIVLFGVVFFSISLLPFLGLGNIASRYSYLASIGIVFLQVFFIQKLYTILLANGRDIALTATSVIASIFCLLQLMQLQGLHNDWFGAGEKVQNFFISIDSLYVDTWKTQPIELHFVNVPIRQGHAWIFPVGLPDALWFVFRNPNLKIYQWNSLPDAFIAVPTYAPQKRIFQFNPDGSVSEVARPAKIQ